MKTFNSLEGSHVNTVVTSCHDLYRSNAEMMKQKKKNSSNELPADKVLKGGYNHADSSAEVVKAHVLVYHSHDQQWSNIKVMKQNKKSSREYCVGLWRL